MFDRHPFPFCSCPPPPQWQRLGNDFTLSLSFSCYLHILKVLSWKKKKKSGKLPVHVPMLKICLFKPTWPESYNAQWLWPTCVLLPRVSSVHVYISSITTPQSWQYFKTHSWAVNFHLMFKENASKQETFSIKISFSLILDFLWKK